MAGVAPGHRDGELGHLLFLMDLFVGIVDVPIFYYPVMNGYLHVGIIVFCVIEISRIVRPTCPS